MMDEERQSRKCEDPTLQRGPTTPSLPLKKEKNK